MVINKPTQITIHLLLYYIAWFACVIGAKKGYIWVGFFTAIVIAALQIFWQYLSTHNLKNIVLMILLFIIAGLLIDSLLLNFDWVLYKSNPFPNISPPWMWGLWLNFSILFYSLLSAYFKKYYLMGILALVGFPVAYYAGATLDAAIFRYTYIGPALVGFIWMITLPVLLFIYNKFQVH